MIFIISKGMRTDVSSATAAFMMLFTASATTVQFTLNGMLDWERNIALPIIGVCGAAVGSILIGRLVERYNRLSLIVFPVAIIMGLSALLMGFTTLADIRHNGAGAFHGPCDDLNAAYNASAPKPGLYNAEKVLDTIGTGKEGFEGLPGPEIVVAVGLVTAVLLGWCLRYVSRACKSAQAVPAPQHHHGEHSPLATRDSLAGPDSASDSSGGGEPDSSVSVSDGGGGETANLVRGQV